MEFEAMQKIWDSQNNRPLYAIDEAALHRRVLSKKMKTLHITNASELLLIIVNLASGVFTLTMNINKTSANIFMYLLAGWMLCTAAYSLVSRIKRKRSSNQFSRTLHGDLAEAVSVATYQVRFSQLMRWNIVPIGSLAFLGVWQGEKSIWVAVGLLVFFVLAFFAGGWEHGIYKNRKHELMQLQKKLDIAS